jgi:hypothetical protein
MHFRRIPYAPPPITKFVQNPTTMKIKAWRSTPPESSANSSPPCQPIEMSKRLPIAKQLKQPEDKLLIENYSDAKWVLGGQWTPEMPPSALPSQN